MRKITSQSVDAFLNATPYNKDNTKVIVTEKTVLLSLFDNRIAFYNKGEKVFYIRTCGFTTNTTKERLNALPNVSIQQKKGIWHLNGEVWNGQTKEISL